MLQPTNNTARLPKSSRRPFNSVAVLIVLIGLLVVCLAALICRQRLYDWWKLHDYTPPAAIAALAKNDDMNSYTRHVFYVNHPQLIGSVKAFRSVCPEDEQDIILGCYHVGQSGIFIYNVQDPELAGIQQVTAAHEVLHAIYARLSPSARTTLDNELEAYYKHGLTNARVIAEIKIYQQTEPGSVFDEMSCTFGTEIANLPADLNNYYRQFFTNRSAIIAYEERYQVAFTSRQNAVTTDDQALGTDKQQINTLESTLSSEKAQIATERQQLSALSSSGQIAAYNAAVPGFNAAVAQYNQGVDDLQTRITTYNQLVASRNSVAGILDTLDQAIDTRLKPQPS